MANISKLMTNAIEKWWNYVSIVLFFINLFNTLTRTTTKNQIWPSLFRCDCLYYVLIKHCCFRQSSLFLWRNFGRLIIGQFLFIESGKQEITLYDPSCNFGLDTIHWKENRRETLRKKSSSEKNSPNFINWINSLNCKNAEIGLKLLRIWKKKKSVSLEYYFSAGT